MKIKLISPRMSLRPMDSEYKRAMSPPLSLLILGALTPREHEIYMEDENVSVLNLEDDPDLVGITVNVDTSYRAYEIALSYRERGIPVIAGGIHASANPLEALNYFDSVLIGEAEEIWETVLKDASEGNLNSLYFNVVPTDLSKVPVPRWEMIDKSKYLYTNIIAASRGCPFKCDFCYNSCEYVHNVYRNRPVANVIEEIKALGTRHVMFIDDNFIGNIKWTREFLKAIKPMRLKWNAAVSANIGAYPDLLDEMKECGCKSLFIGFESINSESVESVGKKQNRIESYESLIYEIHSRGIMVNASLVFGFDHDHKDVFGNTLQWLVKNRVETMTAHILTPYPGTLLYKKFLKEGRMTEYEALKFNTSHVVFKPSGMSGSELSEGYLNIYKDFYRLKNIIKRMPLQKEMLAPYLMFNFIYRKFGGFTSKIAKMGMMNFFGRLARKLSYGID